jgi:hypothetical protein
MPFQRKGKEKLDKEINRMSVFNKLASTLNRKDDVPNQKLAREIVNKKDRESVRELVASLSSSDKAIQSDCIKVLYEIGYIDPSLIAGNMVDFLKQLKSKNNRLVWGGMIALSTIASLRAKDIVDNHFAEIVAAIQTGSVITVDAGIKALSTAASMKGEYRRKIVPFLIRHLQTCRSKEVPMHSELIQAAVDEKNRDEFMRVLEERKKELSSSQSKRVEKVLNRIGSMEK